MDKKAVEAAQIEFDRAQQSAHNLLVSNEYPDVQRHWAAFLVAAGRVFTKLERGAKTRPESIAWFAAIKAKRRTDPILSYIWYARNADEHGIEPITKFHSGSVKFVNPTPEETAALDRQMKEMGKPFLALGMVEVVYPHVRLVDIALREGHFRAPQQTAGVTMAPAAVATLALGIIDLVLHEAESLVL